MLKSEGFEPNNYIDIFDGGPTVSVKVKNIRAVRESEIYPVQCSEDAPTPNLEDKHGLLLVSNRKFENFRVLLANKTALVGNSIQLTPAQKQQLQLNEGDTVRAVSLRP